MPESPGHPLRVFLCHSPNGQPIARELYLWLSTEKWMDVWFMESKLLPSQDWNFEIKKAVQDSDVLVVLNSSIEREESYPNLAFILNILGRKPKRSIPIIVLRLDDHLLAMHTQIVQVIDYFPKNQRKFAVQGLISSLKFHADRLQIALTEKVTLPETDKFLQWSPSNWKNLILFKEAEELDDQSVNLKPDSIQKTEREAVGRTKSVGAILWTMAGLLVLLIFGLLNTHHTTDDAVANTALPFPMPTLGIGSMRVVAEDGMKILYVPAGEFLMGGNIYFDEKPVHRVNLNAFWIDQTEVTNVMFATFLTEEGNREEGGETWLDASDEDSHIHLQEDSWQADQGFEDHPVVEVTWYGANAYCLWAGRRLPTEAEWEKAARGVSGNTFPWGNQDPTSDVLNFNNTVGGTTKVGSYPSGASPYGALDMAGNAWEWVADRYSRAYYANSPLNNPTGPATGFFRVLRGGAWNYRETYARSMNRNRGNPTISHDFIGFRCASDAFPQ